MGKNTSRRSFLSNSVMATTGLAFFTSTDIVRAFTADESPFKGYNPFAPVKNDLRVYPFGRHVKVSGKIYNDQGTKPLQNVSIEVWHLTPNSDNYKHRARLYTDESGSYSFITDLPAREMGRNYRIYFKVSDKTNCYFTELSFNNSGAYISDRHWESNNQLGEERLFPKQKVFLNQSNIAFNIALNNQ